MGEDRWDAMVTEGSRAWLRKEIEQDQLKAFAEGCMAALGCECRVTFRLRDPKSSFLKMATMDEAFFLIDEGSDRWSWGNITEEPVNREILVEFAKMAAERYAECLKLEEKYGDG